MGTVTVTAMVNESDTFTGIRINEGQLRVYATAKNDYLIISPTQTMGTAAVSATVHVTSITFGQNYAPNAITVNVTVNAAGHIIHCTVTAGTSHAYTGALMATVTTMGAQADCEVNAGTVPSVATVRAVSFVIACTVTTGRAAVQATVHNETVWT
jgi:hypothetical protein